MDSCNAQILKIVTVVFLLGVAVSQDYDYPSYSEADLPETSFSCKDKTNGGYYADIETDCQMYHVCSKDKFGFLRSTRFLCGNGTVFDQRNLVCQDYRRVQKCQDSPKFYRNAPRSFSPFLEEDNLPETGFSCEGKANGGYYADIETGCEMYHVCTKDKYGMRSTKFRCGDGTVFDQRYLACQDVKKVYRCKDSERYYRYPSHIGQLNSRRG